MQAKCRVIGWKDVGEKIAICSSIERRREVERKGRFLR